MDCRWMLYTMFQQCQQIEKELHRCGTVRNVFRVSNVLQCLDSETVPHCNALVVFMRRQHNATNEMALYSFDI